MKIRAMLAALCCVAGLVFVTGCDSPEKGFKEWQSALLKGDIGKAKARTARGAEKFVEMVADNIKDAENRTDLENTKIVSCSKNGDTATLTLKTGRGDEISLTMIKEDGKWKVAQKIGRARQRR